MEQRTYSAFVVSSGSPSSLFFSLYAISFSRSLGAAINELRFLTAGEVVRGVDLVSFKVVSKLDIIKGR